MRSFPLKAGLCLAAVLAASAASAQNFSNVLIDGIDSVYGLPGLPISYDGSGLPAVQNVLNPGSGRILSFSSVTGATTANGANAFGPDGGTYSPNTLDIQNFNNLSGVYTTTQNRHMALFGVFTAGTPAGSAPARLDVTSDAFTSLSPVLDQVFLIGDGRVGSGGAVQQFLVPDNATELYLGFADGFYDGGVPFQGRPSAYNDNTGALTASYSVVSSAVTPEPGAWALLGASVLTGAGLLRRRK